MLLKNLVTRRVSEENASDSSLTRRVTKQGHLLLAALAGGYGKHSKRDGYFNCGPDYKYG